MTAAKAKQRRGLACLPPEKVREIASLGGKAAQRPGGRGHKWTKAEARAMRQAQLERKREEEEFQLRLRARLRKALGPSPGPGPTDASEPPEGWEECAVCGHYHPKGWEGDCREDLRRWPRG